VPGSSNKKMYLFAGFASVLASILMLMAKNAEKPALRSEGRTNLLLTAGSRIISSNLISVLPRMLPQTRKTQARGSFR
jgi:hypothetical protein